MQAVTLFCVLVTVASFAASGAEPEVKQKCIYAPLPEYPAEARARNLEGDGMFVLHLDQKKGTVMYVTVEKSTGYRVLDNAAIDSLKRWKFIRNIDVPMVKVPFTFTTHGIPPDWKIVE
jgi:TonB family protein